MTHDTAPFAILHVYAQAHWHADALLVGTREALTRLRDALTVALVSPQGTASVETFTSDGEGYACRILTETEDSFNGYAMPYTSDSATPDQRPAHNPAWPKRPRR